MNFKGGMNFQNDALYSTKSNQFKGVTTIIISTRFAPQIEKHGVFILG